MRIALLAGLTSIHTIRWTIGLAERGHEIHIITCHSGGDPLLEKVTVHELPYKPPQGYFLNKLFADVVCSTSHVMAKFILP